MSRAYVWSAFAGAFAGLASPAPARAQQPPPAATSPAPAGANLAPSGESAPGVNRRGSGLYDQDVTWDLNLEGGWGAAFGDAERPVGFGRIRGGVLWVHEPWFSSAGAFYDFSSFTPGTFGVQIEQMHLSSGLWVQAGGGIDVQPRPMAMAGVGWSLFGVELQYRDFGPVRNVNTGFAVYGTLRVPVSIIARVFRTRHHP